MRRNAKNIIMITAGGVGQRFGGNQPKQYLLLNGKPIIEYVINACKASKRADEILVVADPYYHREIRDKYDVYVTDSGSTLNITKRKGFDYIRDNTECEKLIVADAVRPTVFPELFDDFFDLLDKYDAVACARKITDSLGCHGAWKVNREEYFTINAPEGFNFRLIDRYFQPDSIFSESIQQLPEDTKVYYKFDIPYFDKVTFPEDLIRIEAMLRWQREQIGENME